MLGVITRDTYLVIDVGSPKTSDGPVIDVGGEEDGTIDGEDLIDVL